MITLAIILYALAAVLAAVSFRVSGEAEEGSYRYGPQDAELAGFFAFVFFLAGTAVATLYGLFLLINYLFRI